MHAPDSSANTSVTLLERLKTNDQVAWSRLVHLYSPLVRTWAARRGVDGADVDDVIQDVFVAVNNGLSGFRRDRAGDSFRGWLHGVTRNVLLLHFRRAARQPQAAGGTVAHENLHAVAAASSEAEDPADSPAELTALYHRGLELVKADFEDRTWQMFWQHVVDGRTPADVAADMGVSSASVRQAKFRVLRRLRDELGDILEQ